MSDPEFDVAVVGAGIVGASCAWECVRAGLRVVVLESGVPGQGTTATNMGQIVVGAGSEPGFLFTRFSAQLWAELAPDLPAKAEYRRLGTIWIASNETEMTAVEQRRQYYSSRGVRAEVLDEESLRREEPNLRNGFPGALWMPDDSVVNASAATEELLARAEAAGGRIRPGCRVEELLASGVRLSAGKEVTAAHVVNAAGVASPLLSPGVPVRPRKGHLASTDPRPGFVRHQLMEMGYVSHARDVQKDSISFNVQPQPSGELRIGSSRQLGVSDLTVDPAVIRSMVDRATSYMPALAGFPIVRTSTGLRPASADGLPLIGPWPPQENVYLATGHEGLGITMALGTGRLIADQLVERRSSIPIDPYLPERVLRRAEG